MKLSLTEHDLFAASKSLTRADTQSFLAGSSGQLLHIVICVACARAGAAFAIAAVATIAANPIFRKVTDVSSSMLISYWAEPWNSAEHIVNKIWKIALEARIKLHFAHDY